MEESDSLALGLTVGILAFFCILFLIGFYVRNRRKQKQEDIREQQIDLELQDNHSFVLFREELNKQSERSPQKQNLKTPEVNQFAVHKEGSFNSSGSTPSDFSSGNRNTNTNTNTSNSDQIDEEDFEVHGHQKTNSAYDFYESFIPILPEEKEPSNTIALPTPKFKLHKSSDSMDKSANSSTSSVNDKANHNLAKQLNGQSFFEKLPSRAGTIKPPPTIIGTTTRTNSTSSLTSLENGEGHDAINDSYVYKSKAQEVQETTEEPDSEAKGKLANILGNNFDNSFRNDGNDGDVVFK